MELGNQIKKMRNELSLSQDELAEKIFVSRQSISNWENDKTYPDIKSCIFRYFSQRRYTGNEKEN